MILIDIALPLLFMALLIRFRVRLEIVLPAGALVLALLFDMGPLDAALVYGNLFGSMQFLALFCVIFFVMLLGELMERGKILTQMSSIFLSLFRDNRIAAAASTAFIGLLPMPGGSLLSAPFVEKLVPSEKNEHKLVLNYWYRHIWEYFYPLYSGMAWIITVMKAPPLSILLYLGPLSLIMIAAGLPFIRHAPRETPPGLDGNARPYRLLLIGWPILLAVSVSLAGVPLWIAVIIAVTAFVAVNRELARFTLPYLFSKKTIFTVFMTAGIVYFERIVREAGVATAIYEALRHTNAEIVVFTLSLVIGLLTGISIAFISIVFPIISPFLVHDGALDMPLLAFAYTGGFTGVMLSPTHLCLIVTTDYFKTRLSAVYPLILRAGLAMTLGGGIYYVVLRMVT